METSDASIVVANNRAQHANTTLGVLAKAAVASSSANNEERPGPWKGLIQHLDFAARPRLSRGDPAKHVEVHNKKHATDVMKYHILAIANSWGFGSLKHPRRVDGEIAMAACSLVFYDYGYEKPISGSEAVFRWWDNIKTSIKTGETNPIQSKCGRKMGPTKERKRKLIPPEQHKLPGRPRKLPPDPKRVCIVPGCTANCKRHRLCQRHGGKPQNCKRSECPKLAQYGKNMGFCKVHAREEHARMEREAKIRADRALLAESQKQQPPQQPPQQQVADRGSTNGAKQEHETEKAISQNGIDRSANGGAASGPPAAAREIEKCDFCGSYFGPDHDHSHDHDHGNGHDGQNHANPHGNEHVHGHDPPKHDNHAQINRKNVEDNSNNHHYHSRDYNGQHHHGHGHERGDAHGHSHSHEDGHDHLHHLQRKDSEENNRVHQDDKNDHHHRHIGNNPHNHSHGHQLGAQPVSL